jgi:hypothetical protein
VVHGSLAERRGSRRRNDPGYRIRNVLRAGADKLTPRRIARLDAAFEAGDPKLRSDGRVALLSTTGLHEVGRQRTTPGLVEFPGGRHPEPRAGDLTPYVIGAARLPN